MLLEEIKNALGSKGDVIEETNLIALSNFITSFSQMLLAENNNIQSLPNHTNYGNNNKTEK